MRSIEKALLNYVQGKGAKVSNETLCFYAEKDPNAVINLLFKIINQELDQTRGVGTLERVRDLFQYIQVILINFEQVNRKIVIRKLKKLDEKIDRLKEENRNKFINLDNAYSELEKTRKELERMFEVTDNKETRQYDLMNYLVNAMKNITYLEYTLSKMPSLVNVKNKESSPLIKNIIEHYIASIMAEEEENILYYSNLVSLILSKKSFDWSDTEKKECLNLVNDVLQRLKCSKKDSKQNKEKIEWLEKILTVLKGEKDKSTKIDIIANRYNISVFFDEELIEQARLVKTPKTGTMTDREVNEEYVITIDGENALEIDDALSCRKLPNGNYLLGVHIASILGYFPYESPIVKEALRRNRSIYLPRRYQVSEKEFSSVIPIFPYEFATHTASLIEGEPKLTRSYIFEINPEGNIVKEDFKKTITTSRKKCTYREIDEILEKGCSDRELEETVRHLQALTDILEKRYKGTELYEQIKESSEDYSDLIVKRIGSEKIVYQTMLLTGNRVAKFFANSPRNYPCLYRVHEINEEDAKKLESMIKNLTKTYGEDKFKKLYQLLQGIYPKGWYDTTGSHVGLGLDHYCHCTSGLRRAADIVVEHALEVCYDQTPTDEELERLESEIKSKVIQINSKQDPIEWFVKDFKKAYQRRR
mgnify:CR=1 FL=1